MSIDAHVHFRDPAGGDHGRLTPDLDALHRRFLPDELLPLLAAAGVDGVVAVQAAATEAETRFLFGLARAHPIIMGVVGWVDLAASDASARIAALAAEGPLKGIRAVLQDLPDPAWVARPDGDAGFAALVERDLAFDALVRIDHLPALAARIARTPGLRVVIDHGAKPDIAQDGCDHWTAALAPFAAMPGVMCKLSGPLIEAAGRPVDRHARRLIDAFGAERLIWGSDWPALTPASDYAGRHAQARGLVDDDRVFGGNARAFYRLGSDALLVLQASDNVGVALRSLRAGERVTADVAAATDIGFGFKVALIAIAEAAKITKYGVPIGSATRDIAAGERVHLENMRSDYTATHTRDVKEPLS